jgi:hypothetical protein
MIAFEIRESENKEPLACNGKRGSTI